MEMDDRAESAARFERIEAYQEATARDIAAISATQRDHSATQRDHKSTLREHTAEIAKLFKLNGEIIRGGKALLGAQKKSNKKMEELAVKSAETQGKLDTLILVGDDWIRERGGKNGGSKPTN